MIFKQDFKTGIKDIGKDNLVKNRAILEILENAGAYQSDEVGYGANDVEKTKLVWILSGWKLHVIKRPKYGQTIHVHTWGRDMAKAITYRDFEIYDSKNNLCAIATSKWVLINSDSKKLTRITDDIIDKYQVETKSVFEEREIEKIRIPKDIEYENCINYKVSRRDIDINGHMHNLYYLDLAYEALPEDVYKNRPYDNVQIQYRKEIKLGETVICKYVAYEEKNIVAIYSQDEKILHAIVELY